MKYTNYTIKHTASIPNIHNLPIDNIMEIAFTGRSNTGKSSTINILINQKISKTSKTPGCTKLINLFEIPKSKIRLIDFPGYGYAKITKKIKQSWEITINQYLKTRKNLIGVILVIDIRRSINKIDHTIIQQNNKNNIKTLILLNKADKLTKYAASIQLKQMQTIINIENIEILIFSSHTSKGINNLRHIINKWCKKPQLYNLN